MKELTRKQLNRQDFVDISIYHLINELVPPTFYDKKLDWNINWISNIRISVENILKKELSIETSNLDQFDMDFYPYLEEENEIEL